MMIPGIVRVIPVALLAAAILFLLPLTPPADGQEAPPTAQEEPARGPDSTEGEAPTPTEEILAPLEEPPPPAEEASVETEAPDEIANQPIALPAPEEAADKNEYTVQEGDTLWDISNAFLNDSFLWPKIWKNNQFITNPPE